jgi:hypothetical protein
MALIEAETPITEEEIEVTCDLAGPSTVGGVCIMLQQPAENHPFAFGIETVMDECATLDAIKDAWAVVTSGAPLPTILDLHPFIRPSFWKQAQVRRFPPESSVFDVLVTKRPEVLIAMGKQKDYNLPELRPLESIGVGQQYPSGLYPLAPGYEVCRVNCFHPSFAINYNRSHSCFRQLMLLEIAHGWAVLNGTWNDEPWMDELRDQCKSEGARVRGEIRFDCQS